VTGTPGGFLLRFIALPFPRAAGVGVALTEIAIGLLTVVGLVTRLAAAAGLALNLLLFLTASWSTTPYFLGSDIVFCFAWLPLALVGAADQPAIDTLVLRRPIPAERAVRRTRTGAHVYGPAQVDPHTRRALLRRALVLTGAATLSIGALATAMRGSARLTPAVSALGASNRRTKSAARSHPKPDKTRPGPARRRRSAAHNCPPVRSSWGRRPGCRRTRRRSTTTPRTALRTSWSGAATALWRPSAPYAPTPAARSTSSPA
jgi:TQO small subunit DoxD